MSGILTDILMSVYQSLGYSILTAVFMMFYYLYISDSGVPHSHKDAILLWLKNFKKKKEFRLLFVIDIYFVMILFRTLLNRNMWSNPLSDVTGGWYIWKYNLTENVLEINAECIENVILLLPFIFLLLCFLDYKNVHYKLFQYVVFGLIYSFTFSYCIEFVQLLFRVGTFQFSDIFYNSVGGGLGAIAYYCYSKIKLILLQ